MWSFSIELIPYSFQISFAQTFLSIFAMGSNGKGSHDERCGVTLQIQLLDRRRNIIPVKTNLDLTVEEFKRVLADRTGIPSNEQGLAYNGGILKNPDALRSYGLFLFSFHYRT